MDNPLSPSYYYRFMKRHKRELTSTRGYNKDTKRELWGTYTNMDIMYDGAKSMFLEAGCAKECEPHYRDIENQPCSKEDAHGEAIDIEITHPDWIAVLDETGCNTNMVEDKKAGGKKYIGVVGQPLAKTGDKTDNHFTLIPVTTLAGNTLMCHIIFKGNSPTVPDDWKSGVDKTVTLIDAEDRVTKIAINSGPGKVFPYGPVCHVNGVEVPCLCSISPHGGVTGEILTDTLRHLDKLGVYKDRGVNGNPSKPCLILDGHSSRFELPFLRYIDDVAHGDDPEVVQATCGKSVLVSPMVRLLLFPLLLLSMFGCSNSAAS